MLGKGAEMPLNVEWRLSIMQRFVTGMWYEVPGRLDGQKDDDSF